MDLLDARKEMAPRPGLRVVRRALVRVLAVREVGDLLVRERERVREALAVAEPRRNRRLVAGGDGEGLGGEAPARFEGQLTLRLELAEHLSVALRPAHGSTVGEVLRGAAEHR